MRIDDIGIFIGVAIGMFFVLAPVVMILKAVLDNKETLDQDGDAANATDPMTTEKQTTIEKQVDRLVNSLHYVRHKALFDYLCSIEQPQYKIDWLLLSLDMGHKISEQFVRKSIEMGLPYFCETESELMMVADPEKPAYQGSVRGMLDAAFLYNMPGGIHTHKEKCGY